ncbi:MAG: hypothetical protein ISS17_01475 [Bacteroidales bacterium]|nr:hypothetical protein [Deltaproteobacteria bacterium]MBL7137430.1 hypothetical protein [Bacteroidales bacterium]
MATIVSRLKTVSWQQFVVITLIALVAVSFDSCKSSGKLTRKEKKAQIEMYKKQMREIINGTTKMTFDEQVQAISEAINKNFRDDELNQLILQAQQKNKNAYADYQKEQEQKVAVARNKLYDLLINKQNLSADELEHEMDKIKAENLNDDEINELLSRLEKKISEMRQYSSVEMSLKSKLEGSFQSIADASRAGNTSMANSLIDAALNYFSAPDVPVLIIISRQGSVVDYDKPTTIINYLNFLKDQKESRNSVDSYQMDPSGKIKELDLIK